MPNAADICQGVVENVNGSLACGVIDMKTGMLLGIHHVVPYFAPASLEAIAAAAVEMFAGRTVKRIEELLGAMSGATMEDSFEEIFIASRRAFHFMMLIREKNAILVLVTRRDISQGMGWAAIQSVLPDLFALLP